MIKVKAKALKKKVQIQKEKFDFTRSGTTVVLIIQLEEHVICANTGDSRAIAVYDDKLCSLALVKDILTFDREK